MDDRNNRGNSSKRCGQGTNYLYTLNYLSLTPISSGPQADPIFTGLGAGVYSITVTDGWSCGIESTQ
jgi:hypothetical protein